MEYILVNLEEGVLVDLQNAIYRQASKYGRDVLAIGDIGLHLLGGHYEERERERERGRGRERGRERKYLTR